jgi:GNAT superfamily N-acetyltransferase
MPTPPMIRHAHPRDRPGVLATVVAAFVEDPGWAFILGEEYERLAPEFVGALFDLRAPGGNVWVSDDLATVAMWESPIGDGGDDDDGQWTRTKKAWARYVSLAGEEAHERLVAYKTALAAVCPADPYWYLGVLATHPERQREGLATAVMSPILDQADRLGIACCLETSTLVNRHFYEQRGFTRATEIILPGGPDTWWLHRPPKGMAVT